MRLPEAKCVEYDLRRLLPFLPLSFVHTYYLTHFLLSLWSITPTEDKPLYNYLPF